MKYNKKVLQEFMHPKNIGEIKNPDGIGKVGNVKCGDVMYVYLKIGKRKIKDKTGKIKQEDYIKDIKFKTLGCAAAIATSSVLTQLVKGKSLKQANKIRDKDIIRELGGLPLVKYHCSLLGTQGLKKAIKDFRIKNSDSARKSIDSNK